MSADKRRRNAWELGRKLFGREGSGRSDLSRNAKQIMREKVHARKRARDSRRQTGD